MSWELHMMLTPAISSKLYTINFVDNLKQLYYVPSSRALISNLSYSLMASGSAFIASKSKALRKTLSIVVALLKPT